MVARRHFDSTRASNRPMPLSIQFTPKAQHGVFSPMAAVLLVLIFSLCSMALGLAQVYNRKVELQGMANAVALAAARELNGTDQGVTLALQKAATTASRFLYNYKQTVVWSDSAISFATSPHGPWIPSGAGNATNLYYVKVDTTLLGGSTGTVSPIFMRFLDEEKATVEISASAVAGRMGSNVLPLAICALDKRPAVNRSSELVEYGFRRGVPYDLMQLNPDAKNPESFVIDPLVSPGTGASQHHTSENVVGPFVCTGKMWMPRVTGGKIQVSRPFPLDSLYRQLNSRFDQYEGGRCSPNGAPPDVNIMAFTGTWMSPKQDQSHVASWSGDDKLRTVADTAAVPAGTNTRMWGALWSYAPAVKFSSYQTGKPEPQPPLTGYATFSVSDLATLYQAGVTAPGYPTGLEGGIPYKALIKAPSLNKRLAEPNRRVLNVPLLSCPISSASDVKADVLAVGKFFMTEPATSAKIVAEFAGIAPEHTLVDQVELFK